MKKAILLLIALTGMAAANGSECILDHYTVERGKTLSETAQKYYGSWREKYQAAIMRENDQIVDAGTIYEDDELVIPCFVPFAVPTKLFSIPQVKAKAMAKALELPEALFVWSAVIPHIPTAPSSAPEPKRAVAVVEGDGYTATELTALSFVATHIAIPASLTKFQPQVETKVKAEVKPAKIKNADNKPKKAKPVKETFQVNRFVASGSLKPGSYPAVFVEKQDKRRLWRHKKEITVTVEEVNGKILCSVLLERKPEINSAVGIDWLNGQPVMYISGDLLVNGKKSEAVLPRKLDGKLYKTLDQLFPTRPHPLMTTVRIFLPTGMKSGLAYATMGPAGLVVAPASLATSLVWNKLQKHQDQVAAMNFPPAIQYQLAGQNIEIKKLETQIASITAQLEKLQKTVNETKEGN